MTSNVLKSTNARWCTSSINTTCTSKLKNSTSQFFFIENIIINYTLFLFIAFSLLFQATSLPNFPPSKCFIRKFNVYIVSHLPSNSPPLKIHCFSKDDDLGYHDLAPNVEYNFTFGTNPFATMFACRFRWNGKNKAFHIYDANWDEDTKRCIPDTKHEVCYYVVQPEGFYFTNMYPPKERIFMRLEP